MTLVQWEVEAGRAPGLLVSRTDRATEKPCVEKHNRPKVKHQSGVCHWVTYVLRRYLCVHMKYLSPD